MNQTGNIPFSSLIDSINFDVLIVSTKPWILKLQMAEEDKSTKWDVVRCAQQNSKP